MSFLKSTLALLGLTFILAACETVPTNAVPASTSGPNAADFVQMDQVFQRYAPLPFKPMTIAEARANLEARGYQRSSQGRRGGATNEIWRGVYARGGKNVARGWVSLDTCANSTLLAKTRVSLTDMSSALSREMLGFVRTKKSLVLIDERRTGSNMRYVLLSADRPEGRNRTNVPRGEFIYSLGGLRIFDNGNRRIGISTHTSCG